MHTFFINTSKKELNEYDVLFDIHYENKTLVSIKCPMSDWYKKDEGYISCVKQMSDMIDGYVELNNTFNVIIYIDLADVKMYSSIPRDEEHDIEREECCQAMRILYTHIISESIVKELTDSGRKPQNVLIMFGEEKHFVTSIFAPQTPANHKIKRYFFGFMGLPESDAVENVAKEVSSGDATDKVAEFSKKLEEICQEEIIPGIRNLYADELKSWCEVIINEKNVQRADDDLLDRVRTINQNERDRKGLETVSCPYDFYSCKVNKSELALCRLNIALHILKCVEAGSVYENGENKNPIAYRQYTREELAPIFRKKERMYSEKAEETETLTELYTKLGLVQPLHVFDHDKFGLDEYGDKAFELTVRDAAPKNKDENNKESSENPEDAIEIKGNTKNIVGIEKEGHKLFSKDEYKPFDYNCDDGTDRMLKKDTKPEEYVEMAKIVRKHHIDYLKKLKIHISEVMSNYAGKSKENKPALLQMGGYRYAGQGKEEKVLETVEGVAEKAYETVKERYMEFCAARSVALTDIEEQCDWFVSRVDQITESLKKIKRIAIGMLVAVVLLYIPFAVIQFEAIFRNVLTLTTAACSVAVPVVLTLAVLSVLAAKQRKKYIEAWKQFKEKSDEALAENAAAVRKYDQLLSVIVPALRWVYEYKLDVEHFAECCSVADAKIEHHRMKLLSRVRDIQNIISDLEFIDTDDAEQSESSFDDDSVDYNSAFCSGRKNRSFYSVIDKEFLSGKSSN